MSTLTSGSRKVTPQQLRVLALGAVRRGTRAGINKAIDEYLPHVAKEHGALRETLKIMLLEQVVFKGNAAQISITFDEGRMISLLDYSEYHIDGKPWHPGDVSNYTNPKIPGTRPIQKKEIMGDIKTESNEQIRIELKALGLGVK